MNTDSTVEPHTTFKLGYVPGVTPGKWIGMWNERRPDIPLELINLDARDRAHSVRTKETHASLVRLPILRDGLHVIELYRETPVVVFPKEHHFAAVDALTIPDLTDEIVLHPLDDLLTWSALPGLPAEERPETTAAAIELVAAGIGVIVVPQSLARLHHRKDLTYLPLSGAPESPIAFVWEEHNDDPLIDEFIGIVRGRSAKSSRSARSNPQQQKIADEQAQEQLKEERAARRAQKQTTQSRSRTTTQKKKAPAAGKNKRQTQTGRGTRKGR
ncbi:LysR family substrate-binding domain-containing protein [Timonella sp. A28]|uniref:LysR family substrate-binding domain-containing protein n=1 Tax=Timonella sp. A28 TaxID=3442640 RepID=UPI003EB83A9F